MSRTRFLLFSCGVCAAIVLFVTLGCWQTRRLMWKEEWQSTINSHRIAPPVALNTLNPHDDVSYRRVTAPLLPSLHKNAWLAGQMFNGVMGYHLLVPAMMQEGGYILLNRGWVPEKGHYIDTVRGIVPVTGVLMPMGVKNRYTPDNVPARNDWYWLDGNALQMFFGLDQPLYPWVLVEDRAGNTPPIGGQIVHDLPNNHLAYLLTWYGLAVVTAISYGFWVRRQRPRAHRNTKRR